ncbi:uncharacterized protein LOC112588555 isoform X2 [Harpegnathos saltator]|uniref:uncharacterized protein LOC112588555 isoform X2 n=1 Tax=Harpegnathos saltator TaxID=610380 RepID=UPI000DBEE9BB|nr:uncharacterized protein LOC112588555 isoform X2 [Harpegnathos saltator]
MAIQVADDTNVCVEKLTEPYNLSERSHWNHRTQKLYFVDLYMILTMLLSKRLKLF